MHFGCIFETTYPASQRHLRGVVSSIVNEGIRTNLNLFIIIIFFLQKDFTRTKSTKCIQANKNKKNSIFMRIKNI